MSADDAEYKLEPRCSLDISTSSGAQKYYLEFTQQTSVYVVYLDGGSWGGEDDGWRLGWVDDDINLCLQGTNPLSKPLHLFDCPDGNARQ